MTFEELSRQFEKLWVDLCEDGEQDPLACAGIMMAQAIKIYKTALPKEDFERMMDTISDSKDIVKPLRTPTLN